MLRAATYYAYAYMRADDTPAIMSVAMLLPAAHDEAAPMRVRVYAAPAPPRVYDELR